MLHLMPHDAAPLLEPEFFSVAAGVAGTLWAITIALFAFVTGGVVRSGVLNRVGVLFVLIVGFLVIVTISNLFLYSMLLALGELMPPGSRHVARIVSAFVLSASSLAAILLSMTLNWKSLPKDSPAPSKDNTILDALYWTCLPFNLVMVIGAWLLTVRGNPDCIVCRILDESVDVIVLVAVALGCLVSLLLGMASMQVSFWRAATEPATLLQGDDLSQN